ncbi:hypothetical protein AX16_007034 [Volvariella volvacea WC 439]|nr:hypothetical protein AX16_007034 [Volvariella volvacea WC 439]
MSSFHMYITQADGNNTDQTNENVAPIEGEKARLRAGLDEEVAGFMALMQEEIAGRPDGEGYLKIVHNDSLPISQLPPDILLHIMLIYKLDSENAISLTRERGSIHSTSSTQHIVESIFCMFVIGGGLLGSAIPYYGPTFIFP